MNLPLAGDVAFQRRRLADRSHERALGAFFRDKPDAYDPFAPKRPAWARRSARHAARARSAT